MSKDEKRALTILEKTTRKVNGHYEIGLLWKSDDVVLSNNKTLAVKRLQNLENKLQKQPQLAIKYAETLSNYISKGHARKLTSSEILTTTDKTNYIPHHCVLNPKKPDKLRVVFDAAARYQNLSLNNMLIKGPDFMNNLVSTIIRFRGSLHAVTADIEQMFHQVKVPLNDQDALRFLWRNESTKPIDEYAMTVHLFGKNDSPCCANYALKRCAIDETSNYEEEVLNCIENDFYMDDYLNSNESETKLLDISLAVIEVLAKASFRLTKWITNNDFIYSSLSSTELAKRKQIESILGILWDVNNDEFKINLNEKDFACSKRGILSCLCSVFDPLGILIPYTLELKLLIQELWRRKINWDDELPQDVQSRWVEWKKQSSLLSSISINRYYGFDIGKVHLELHCFCDASSQAYGAVCYLRAVINNSIKTAFVISKCRLAPLNQKAQTIPKLELRAAV